MRFSSNTICSIILLLSSCNYSISQNLIEAPCECSPFAISLNTYPIHFRNYKGSVGVLYRLNNNGEISNCLITSLNIINEKERINYSASTIHIFEEDLVYPDSIIQYLNELTVKVQNPKIERTTCINNQREYIISMYFKICQE